MSLFHNVPGWERVVRIAVGLGGAAAGAVWAGSGEWLGWVAAASGLSLAVTGVVGWCPLCAMVGRKLPPADRTVTIERL